ncbi:MAG: PilN domain-containing protein [Flavobacteriales bacterium]|nr:PilN domain-containing protein [Flavobacteriales bacterium]
MLKEKLTSFIEGNTAYGIDLKLSDRGEVDFFLTELSLKKNEVLLLQKLKGNGLEELFSKDLDNKLPVYLNVRGRGVLSKISSHKEGDSDLDLIQKSLPNIKADELYFYSASITASQSWIQFIRKSILDELLKKFKAEGFQVIEVNLGTSGVNNITSIIENQRIVFESKELEIVEGRLLGWNDSKEESSNVKLGDEFIPSYWLLAYAVAFNHFLASTGESILSENIMHEREEFTQRKMFSLGLKVILAFFLSSLLINFFLFQDYSLEFNQLNDRLQLNKNQLDRLNQLRIEKENKETFFLKTDLISASNSTYYADRLASSKPKGITWNELNINPSKRKIEKGEDIEFDIKTINISGIAKSSTVLNDWITLLKQEEWIKTINIKNFQKLERKEISKFKLQVEVR